MAVHIAIRVRGWPDRVRINIEANEDGTPISGDVVIVARKNNDPSTDQNLGFPQGELIAHVVNGRWSNNAAWDYSHWKQQRFNRLVAKFGGQETSWGAEERRLIPTKISEIHYTATRDTQDPTSMLYSLAWTILDQFGNPIGGRVTVQFDGTTERSEPEDPNLIGVCTDRVIVTGVKKELTYKVIQPNGFPRTVVLKGPDDLPDEPKATKFDCRVVKITPFDDRVEYRILVQTLDQKGNQIPAGACSWTLGTGHGNGDVNLTNAAYGFVDVVVREVEAKLAFCVTCAEPFLNFSTNKDGTPLLALSGPKKPEPKAPEAPITLEVDVPYCQNSDGSFTISVRSKQGDNLKRDVDFTLSSNEALTATALNLIVLRQGRSFLLKTGSDGTLTFNLTFGNPVQTNVTFGVPGFSFTVTLVKLP